MMLGAIAWVYFFVPESPTFLFEIEDFDRLEECLCQIAKMNGVEKYEKKVKSAVLKLRIDAERDTSFNSDPDLLS